MADKKYRGGIFTQLLSDNSKESHLAEVYLSNFDINFSINHGKSNDLWNKLNDSNASPHFVNSFKNPNLPSLTTFFPGYICHFAYISLLGIEDFLRGIILQDLYEENKIEEKYWYWRDVNTFYPEQDYNGKVFGERKKLVTCFDRNKERIFEGPILNSPFKFDDQLDKHDFKDWHDVSCWSIGKLGDLTKKVNENGVVIDENTATVLFPHDIELLKNNKLVPITDSRCYMQVLFEAYFNNNDNVYGIYTNMID